MAAVEQQVVADVTTHQPAEEELRKYFDENRSNYGTEGTMTLHNLVLPKAQAAGPNAMATAQKAAEALRAQAPLAEVLKTYGLTEVVPEHAGEEQFYFAQKVHLGETLFARVLMLNDGEVSEPVAGGDGIHIVQMIKNTKPLPLTFERVRSQVLTEYIAAAKKSSKTPTCVTCGQGRHPDRRRLWPTMRRPRATRMPKRCRAAKQAKAESRENLPRASFAVWWPWCWFLGPGLSAPAFAHTRERNAFGLADQGHDRASAIHRA